MDDSRLTRMETKIDKLADAMSTLVRMEERVMTVFKRLDVNDERDNNLERRVAVLEKVIEGRAHLLRVADRLFWIVVAAGVTTAFAYFKSQGT